jgi:hypothetical protein
MKEVLLSGLCALGLLVFAACSSDDDGGAAPIPIEELTESVAHAMCDNVADCCQKTGLGFNVTSCRNEITTETQEMVASVQAGTVKYDEQAAGDCVSAIEAATKACNLENYTDACDKVFLGTKAEGEICTDSMECAIPSGGDSACENDVCVVEKPGRKDDACQRTCEKSDSYTTCIEGSDSEGEGTSITICYRNDGLYCDETCKPLISTGATGCGWNDLACPSGDYCANDACAHRKPTGSECSWSNECQESLYCAEQLCAPRKAEGEPCESWDECQGYCSAQNVCSDGSSIGIEVMCTQLGEGGGN